MVVCYSQQLVLPYYSLDLVALEVKVGDPIVWSTTLIELTNVSIFFRIQIRSKSKKEQELEKHLRRDELKNKKAEIAPYSVISAFYLCL